MVVVAVRALLNESSIGRRRPRVALGVAGLLLGSAAIGCSSSPRVADESVQALEQSVVTGDVLGFESPALWSAANGAQLSSSPVHTEGAHSLAVKPGPSNGYTPILSVPLSTLSAVSPTLALDVMLPTAQANPYWFGTMQMYINCPSRNIYSAFLSQVELTGKPLNVWNTLSFPLTSSQITGLLTAGYSDLTLTVVLNVQVPTSGTYLIDNLRFVAEPAGACGGQPNGVLCDDGNACTSGDSCQSGACQGGTAKTCAASDQCHGAGTCDPTTGACGASPAAPDWTACSDGNPCTHGEACHAGVCGQGQATCDDGDPCTADSCSPSSGACTFTPLSSSACTAALGSAASLKGRVAFATESDNNRCVPDAIHVLNRLNSTGDLMAWHYDRAGYAQLDGEHFHTETIVRMPYMAGTPLDGSFFVSAWSHPPGEAGAIMGVAQMQFKGGSQGKLLLTNRAYNENDDGQAPDWNTFPNPGDSFMRLGPQQTPGVVLDPSGVQNHPGGLSAIGTHVAVSLQGFIENCTTFGQIVGIVGIEEGGCTPTTSKPIVQIWDLAQPLNPQLRSSYLTRENGTQITVSLPSAGGILGGGILGGPLGGLIGGLLGGDDTITFTPGTSMMAVAITKLNNGHFLLIGDPDVPVGQFEFYVSEGTDLDDPNLWGTPGRPPDAIVSFSGPDAPPGWQSFNFVTDCNGDLFVLGTRGDVPPHNQDIVENYKIDLVPGGPNASCGTRYCATMTRADKVVVETIVDGDAILNLVSDGEGSKHMQCGDNSGNDQCDMSSGAGTYIDPNGQVIVYSTDYDDDGFVLNPSNVYGNGLGEDGKPFQRSPPYAPFFGFIRGMEFHERHGNHAPGSACPTLPDAWVEFYQDPNYNSFGDDAAQVYRINYTTRNERDRKNFGANDFNDKASSVRWCIPQGSSFKIFRDGLSGPTAVLNGTGHVAQIADFTKGVTYVHPDGSLAAGGSLDNSVTAGLFQENVTDLQGLTGVSDDTN
jgi:hypothetical protein